MTHPDGGQRERDPRDRVIVVRNVAKTYGENEAAVHALRGVSLEIFAREYVAIMGPSGSGKSTLLHILGCMDAPSRGELRICDERIDFDDDDRLASVRRRRFGFVFQAFNLLPSLTAEQNVALPLMLDGCSRADACVKARATLEKLGMGHRLQASPRAMSGGEQQRVAVARALVTDPEIILADEPTGNLDTKNSEQILAILRQLVDELKHTVVVVTHDFSIAAAADRVVLIRDGRVAHEAAGSELTLDSLRFHLAESCPTATS